MKFRLEIDCDNAAFEGSENEIARILRRLSAQFVYVGKAVATAVFDSNGNLVGRVWIEE